MPGKVAAHKLTDKQVLDSLAKDIHLLRAKRFKLRLLAEKADRAGKKRIATGYWTQDSKLYTEHRKLQLLLDLGKLGLSKTKCRVYVMAKRAGA